MRDLVKRLKEAAEQMRRGVYSPGHLAAIEEAIKRLELCERRRQILSCNIQNVTDENGLIKDLGADNTARIKKDAAIAKAQAERDIAIAQADANKAANEAEVQAEQEIAQRNTDLEVKKANLQVKSDTQKAIADAAYEIQKQEQQKTIEATTINAQIAKAEREAELRDREVSVKKKSLDAEVRAQADAEAYRVQKVAEADLFRRQKEAEAKKYEREQEAEAQKKAAEAQKYAREQEAAGIEAVGKAEAAAIEAKALAKAKGIDQKAEAMKKYGDAAIIEIIMNALPEIAKNVAEPLSKVDKITMYGEGNSAKLLSDIINGTSQVTEGFSSGMGIDIKSLIMGALGGKLMSASAINLQTPPSVALGTSTTEPDTGIKEPFDATEVEDTLADNGMEDEFEQEEEPPLDLKKGPNIPGGEDHKYRRPRE